MVLLEAMVAGVPIAASNVGGIPEALDYGRAGILIKPANKASLEEAILKVMQQPQMVQEHVEAAGKRVREIYSSKAMATHYLSLYRQVAENLRLNSPGNDLTAPCR
jgi:glycosyltransferase involved in cell wall biosynthesis